jgi:tetratricopeptide (TPR) repeat protein
MGAPEGLELTLSEGLISGLREFEGGLVVQTSAAISPGSSGGGLFDARGQLVGITTFYLKEGQNLNFALPGDWAQSLVLGSPAAKGQLESDSPAFQALIWFQLGNISEKKGDHEKAVRAYREAIKTKTEEAGIWNNLAVALGNLERYSDERDAAQQATRLKPEMADAWYNLGTAYAHLNQYNEASKAFQEAVRLKPSDAETWYDLGTIYRNLKRNEEAIRALQEAIRLKPEFAEAWNNLGLVYRSSGQTDEAVKAYEEAVRLKPESPEPWYNLGATYALQGNRTKVMKVYETLRQISPDLADTFFRKYVLP